MGIKTDFVVGDTAYILEQEQIVESEVERVYVMADKKSTDCEYVTEALYFTDGDIGKTVFTTREAAQAAAELEGYKEQAKQFEWINADIVPVGYGYILLSFANFDIPVVGRYEEDEEGGAYYVGDDTESCISQDMIVNAWMPLPKPYRGDADE